ncbi:MAG: hypothetical protein KGJ13_08960 [Patescibacteria group bacterium]|nr:hypothetical protein [Patescibacteria group bacterium]
MSSRTTEWRRRKGIGSPRAARPKPKPESLADYSLDQFRREFTTACRKAQAYWSQNYPRCLTVDDLYQECWLELLKNSGKPEIVKPGFRVILMARKLKDLKKKRREEPLLDENARTC